MMLVTQYSLTQLKLEISGECARPRMLQSRFYYCTYLSVSVKRQRLNLSSPTFFVTTRMTPVTEFKEFERRFKFKPALNLNRVLADLNRGSNSLNCISGKVF